MGINECKRRQKIVAYYPALCVKSTATKEITRRTSEDKFTGFSSSSSSDSSSSNSSSSTSSSSRKRKKIHRRRCLETNEPLSPKVGCMGQVKDGSGEKGSSMGGSPPLKNKLFYLLLRRVFSGRRMAMIVGIGPGACARVSDDCGGPKVYVVDFDNPLPVLKQVATSDTVQSDPLWKRRCGFKGLKGLQLQEQRLSLHQIVV